jgi:hypothetical protein
MESISESSKIISMPEEVYFDLLDKAYPDDYTTIKKDAKNIKYSDEELNFLNDLNDMINQQVNYSIEYLNSDSFKRLSFYELQEKEDFFKRISHQCDLLVNSKAENVKEFMDNFYQLGAIFGVEDIEVKFGYTPADEQAFFFINQYAFEKVKGLSQDVTRGLRETIWRGVAEGQPTDVIAKAITKLPLTPLPDKKLTPRQRAQMIAHTESSRALNTGKLQSWANYGIEKVKVPGIGDGLECKVCLEIVDNSPYTLKEAQALLPAHPNCRHTYAPWTILDDPEAQDIGDLPPKPIPNPEVVSGTTINSKSQVVGDGSVNKISETKKLTPEEKKWDKLTPGEQDAYDSFKEDPEDWKEELDSYNKIMNDKNITVKDHVKLKWPVNSGEYEDFSTDETFKRFKLKKEGLTVYASESGQMNRLRPSIKYYESLPKELQTAKEIVISDQKPYAISYTLLPGPRVGGFVDPKSKNKRVFIFNEDVNSTMEAITHECAHFMDGPEFSISNSKEYLDAFNKDKSALESSGLTDADTYVTQYAYDFTTSPIQELSVNEKKKYCEDFAESVKIYKSNPEEFKTKFPNKYKFISNYLKENESVE